MRSRTKSTRQIELIGMAEEKLEDGNAKVAAEEILALLGNGETSSTIRRTFAMMGIAEEVIDARFPGVPKKQTSPAFRLALPTGPVRISDLLYRAHVAELVSRFPDRCDIDPRSGAIWKHLEQLTRAEVIGLLCEASLRHPLGYYDTFMYEMLFRQLFPGVPTGRDETTDPFPNIGERLERARRDAQEWLCKDSPERAPLVAEVRESLRPSKASVPA
jgi:hypothetical protein